MGLVAGFYCSSLFNRSCGVDGVHGSQYVFGDVNEKDIAKSSTGASMKKLVIVAAAIALSGCAHEYAAYAEAHKARAQADAARYMALAEIAKMGDTTAKVAAVISLNAGGGQQAPQIATPRNWAEYALSFTGALLPVVGQMYAVNKQTNLGVRQSDNATSLGIAQANANRDVQTATVAGFSNMAGTGFKAATDIASKIQVPQPNITISGTGVVGGGTLNNMSNSTGVLGTGSYSTDYRPSTSTSTSTTTTCTAPC